MQRFLYATLILSYLYVTLNVCSAQQTPGLLWQNAIGGSQEDGFLGMTTCPDGGYIAVGYTQSTDIDLSANQGMRDYLICKVNEVGQVEWARSYGGSLVDFAIDVLNTQDGGYLIVGVTSSTNGDILGPNYGGSDAWVLKLDASGEVEWENNYGGSNGESIAAAIRTTGGDYILVGGTRSNDGDLSGNNGDVDFWILRIDSNGGIAWSKCYGGSEWDSAQGVVETADGGFVVGGGTLSNNGDVSGNHGEYDFWLVKVNGNGDLQWQRTFGGSAFESISDVAQLTSGDIVAVGSTESLDGDVGGVVGMRDVWVVRASSDGALLWESTFGGSVDESAFTVVETEGGGYVVGGTTASNDGDVIGSNGQRDFWLFELSEDNVLLWQGCYGGSADDNGQVLLRDGVDAYCFAGTTASVDGDIDGGMGVTDAWIIKIVLQQNSIPDFSMIGNQLLVYPNPAIDLLKFNLDDKCEDSSSIDIYSAQMNLVLTSRDLRSALCGNVEMDISVLTPGYYYVKVNSSGGLFYGRFVKM